MFKICNKFIIAILIASCVFTRGSSVIPRIVGGKPARSINIPYIVSLTHFYIHHCGGSIINERTVLTAAHCLQSAIPRFLKVHAGTKTLSSSEGIMVNVIAIHYNMNFNFKTMDYDIGLVRMANALTFSHYIQPISLPSAYDAAAIQDGSQAMVAGWGFTKPEGKISSYLRYAHVPIVNQNICKLQHHGITDRMVCAGYDVGGTDACQSDSGGPLVYGGKLIGIVSWGVSCALPNKPGVYTRISELLSWVQMTLAEEYAESITDGFFGKVN